MRVSNRFIPPLRELGGRRRWGGGGGGGGDDLSQEAPHLVHGHGVVGVALVGDAQTMVHMGISL